MGVNAYTTNLGVRERQSTYVPMPFEEMYAVLQEKQKRYDLADAYERESRKEITKLSSPIAAHNAYLSKMKNEYLDSVMKLHNSIPDKGSSEYMRKIQDSVDAFTSNPNYNLIMESNEAYSQFVKMSTEQMVNGNYSGAAAQPYLNFSGNNPDGSLKKFVFAGLRPKVDINKSILTAIQMTPDENQVISVPKGNTIVTQHVSGKKADKIYNNMLSTLGREGMQDYMFENNLPDEKALRKHLLQVAKSSSDYAVSIKVDPNYEMEKLNYARELHKMNMQEKQLDIAKKMMDINASLGSGNLSSTSLVQFPNANNLAYNETLANMIKPDGSVVEGVWEASPWKSLLKDKFPAVSQALTSDQEQSPENDFQNLLKEQRRNIETVNRVNPGVSKLTENIVRQRYKNSKKTTLNVHAFKDPDDAIKAKNSLSILYNAYTYYNVDGENVVPLTTEQTNNLIGTLKNTKSNVDIAVQGKLNAFNTYGPEALSVKVIGTIDKIGSYPSLIAVTTPTGNTIDDKLAIQEHLLATGYSKGTPVLLNEGYIDPISKKQLSRSPTEIFWKHFNDSQSSRHIVIEK